MWGGGGSRVSRRGDTTRKPQLIRTLPYFFAGFFILCCGTTVWQTRQSCLHRGAWYCSWLGGGAVEMRRLILDSTSSSTLRFLFLLNGTSLLAFTRTRQLQYPNDPKIWPPSPVGKTTFLISLCTKWKPQQSVIIVTYHHTHLLLHINTFHLLSRCFMFFFLSPKCTLWVSVVFLLLGPGCNGAASLSEILLRNVSWESIHYFMFYWTEEQRTRFHLSVECFIQSIKQLSLFASHEGGQWVECHSSIETGAHGYVWRRGRKGVDVKVISVRVVAAELDGRTRVKERHPGVMLTTSFSKVLSGQEKRVIKIISPRCLYSIRTTPPPLFFKPMVK